MKHPRNKDTTKAAMRSTKVTQAKPSPVPDLPIDSANAGDADQVVGGGGKPKPADTPKGSISFNFGRPNVEYKGQTS